MSGERARPVVVITGAEGNIGRSIIAALEQDYTVVGLDREAGDDARIIAADLSSAACVDAALKQVRATHGERLASVIHLAAYFDFTGEDHPLYKSLNVEGTRHLMRALQSFDVEQFVYASTMLVHAPGRAGEQIDEDRAIDPQWVYPRSKAQAEAVLREEAGGMPVVILRLAGLYDEETMVPTLAHQIARIREKNVQSHLYSGDGEAGQAMLHRNDLVDAIRRTVACRAELSNDVALLVGEAEAVGYATLQDRIGALIHGSDGWTTLRVPKPLAAAGAWAQDKLEPIIPDAIDKGEEPFIKPFMVAMADDHYALDISRARELIGWSPRHRLLDTLPAMIAALLRDPESWYEANGVPTGG
ncbi:NAD-dependent epimerase/dehydratase family protein [Blastomonas aquatica]|uniref:NAD-dependent epimerase/dehydratase domain-containing protein n=1 Tax=Blastomonas aquatica TaxID=1510276 RepID=A0ABQ1IZS7_9SPHN|nr:NAD(P)-dependent oxidoreductase [Blastomonas aquatica]GGB55195.1 hypothetical protein GCM10010833_07360 [Blastomonas aquatica]